MWRQMKMTKESNGLNVSCSQENEIASHQERNDSDGEIHSKTIHKYEQESLISEFRHDEVIRFKVILSICATFVYFMMGWCKSQTGPAFLDILHISGTDLGKGSAYMASYSMGCAIGSIIGGSLYSKMNRYILLVVALLIYSLTRALIPWCVFYEVMIIVNLIHGVCAGVITVVAVAVAVSIWGASSRGRVFLNIFLVSDGGAGLIAPIVLTPFLLPKKSDNDPRNFSDSYVAATRNISTLGGNISTAFSVLQSNISHTEIPVSSIYVAYSISAGMVFLSTVPFIFICAKPSKNDYKGNVNNELIFLGKLPLRVKRLQLMNVGIFSTFYMAIYFIFTGYLPAFCVEHLQWTKTSGAWLMSVVYFAMLCGRLFGAFLSHFFKPMKIILLSTILHLIGLIGLSVSGVFLHDVGIWISVCGVGIAWGLTWPSLLSWTNENLIPVRGKITAFIMLMGFAGTLLSPLLFGYMMEEVSPIWFCFLNLGKACITFLNVIFMFMYTRSERKKSSKDKNDNSSNIGA